MITLRELCPTEILLSSQVFSTCPAQFSHPIFKQPCTQHPRHDYFFAAKSSYSNYIHTAITCMYVIKLVILGFCLTRFYPGNVTIQYSIVTLVSTVGHSCNMRRISNFFVTVIELCS